MIELLQHYSIHEIFLFVVLLALAFKSVVSFFEWIQERLQKIFNIRTRKLTEKEHLNRRIEQAENFMGELREHQKVNDETLQGLSKKIDALVQSDRDDIKAYITKEHHKFCYDKGWIDDFSLDCLEKRFKHYEDEGGNSFICGFMEELRALPKQRPKRGG